MRGIGGFIENVEGIRRLGMRFALRPPWSVTDGRRRRHPGAGEEGDKTENGCRLVAALRAETRPSPQPLARDGAARLLYVLDARAAPHGHWRATFYVTGPVESLLSDTSSAVGYARI